MKTQARELNYLLTISFVFFFIEVVGGYLSNSLALISDSFHMFSDTLVLLLSILAIKFTKRPPNSKATFGYQKLGVLITLLNGIFLVLSAIYISLEALQKLKNPQPVELKVMLPVAIFGLFSNLFMLYILKGGHHHLHLKSAWFHLLGDTLSSVFVLLSGFIIYFTDLFFFDSLTSLFIVLLLLFGGFKVIKSALIIFLDLVPPQFDLNKIVGQLKSHPDVEEIHDVHLWSIGQGIYAFTAHVKISDQHLSAVDNLRKTLEKELRSLGITHIVLQMETTSSHEEGELCPLNHHHQKRRPHEDH